MSNEAKIFKYNTLSDVAVRFRSDLNDFDYVLLYAYNGTGKARLSMEFKNRGRDTEANTRDTLYFNAFSELPHKQYHLAYIHQLKTESPDYAFSYFL